MRFTNVGQRSKSAVGANPQPRATGFKITTVDATRAINSKGDKRGVVREVLVQGLRVRARISA